MPAHVPSLHHRRSIRLPGLDYAQPGAYFLTVCTQNRQCLFGEVVGGELVLSEAGSMVRSVWDDLWKRFPSITSDSFVVMPNHIHGIIVISQHASGIRRGEHKVRPYATTEVISRRGESCIRPRNLTAIEHDPQDRPHGTSAGTVGRIVQVFKSITTHEYTVGARQHGWLFFSGRLWQRNYFEHVVRNEEELRELQEYIASNPARWELDRENPVGGI